MSQRPLVLLFATSGHSGVDRVIANLLPEFGAVDRQFHLLTIGGHGPVIPESLAANIRVFRLPVPTKKLVLPPLLWHLRRHRPAALLTANHALNRAALLARRLSGVDTRVVIRMGMSVSAMLADMRPAARRTLLASMARWYPLADAAITPSVGVGDDLVALAGVERARLHVIRNPIVNARFFAQAAEPVTHPWYEDADWPVILGAGSLEPRKDFATLIRAFARLRAVRRARLVILGEGRERAALVELAAGLGVGDDVAMPGFDANPYRHMARAALFVLSSRREGASAVIVEALACGTPVVSTDCPSGPAEALRHGKVGSLVPVGDHVAMAEAMLAALDHPPDGAVLRAAVEENQADRAARRYLEAMGVTV